MLPLTRPFFISRPLCAHNLGEKWGSHRCQRARSSDKRQVTAANLPKPGRHHINDTAIASIFHFGDYKHLTRTPFPFPVVSLCRRFAMSACPAHTIEHAVSLSCLLLVGRATWQLQHVLKISASLWLSDCGAHLRRSFGDTFSLSFAGDVLSQTGTHTRICCDKGATHTDTHARSWWGP